MKRQFCSGACVQMGCGICSIGTSIPLCVLCVRRVYTCSSHVSLEIGPPEVSMPAAI